MIKSDHWKEIQLWKYIKIVWILGEFERREAHEVCMGNKIAGRKKQEGEEDQRDMEYESNTDVEENKS